MRRNSGKVGMNLPAYSEKESSINLQGYELSLKSAKIKRTKENGAGEGNRTLDTELGKLVLYH